MAITTLNLRALNRSDTATSGQVVTATSATAADFQDAAGGAMTMIKRQILNEADTDLSEIEFVHGTSDVVFDGTYDMYLCMISNLLPATNDVEFRCQVRDSSGYKTSSYTSGCFECKKSTSSFATTSASSTDSMLANEKFATESYRTGHGYILLPNPIQDTSTNTYYTTQWHFTHPYGASGFMRTFVGGGSYASAGDYTGFKLYFSSGDVKSMIATLYGYNIS